MRIPLLQRPVTRASHAVEVSSSFFTYRRFASLLILVQEQIPVSVRPILHSLTQHRRQHVRVDADTHKPQDTVPVVTLTVASLSVCVSVCDCVRALKGKRLELSAPKLVEIQSTVGPWHALIIRSKCRRMVEG